MAERDRDLASVQKALRGLEDEQQKLGNEHTSDRFSLELEIDRVKRDLLRAEGDLDQARKDLTRRDLEVAQMVCVPLSHSSRSGDLRFREDTD